MVSQPEQTTPTIGDAETTPLTEPRDGVPELTTTQRELAEYLDRLVTASGPVAIDAERASGFRYGQDAYLVQLRRTGAGTSLIDPQALPDLTNVSKAIEDAEWVLHAADQDLPSLANVGMTPTTLFDTELAGRLLNKPRVGLASLVETELGLSLAKEHSAADWSTRPLPEAWLRYAALDVEVLIELRDVLARELEDAGKDDWARQEFEAIVNAPPTPPRIDPWRRTSGTHNVRDRRQLAIVRSLWEARDRAARKADIAPGRILPDASIIAAALAGTKNLTELREFQRPSGRRRIRIWSAAVNEALNLPESDLPPRRAQTAPGAIPQPRAWRDRDSEAAARLDAVRRIVRTRAIDLDVPQENLLTPEYQRRLAWQPPTELTEQAVADHLLDLGARPWQVENLSDGLLDAVRKPADVIEKVPDPFAT